MPYKMRKLPNQDLYRVYGREGNIKAKGTTETKAHAQLRFLRSIEGTEKKKVKK
jgi:hypothetical protein